MVTGANGNAAILSVDWNMPFVLYPKKLSLCKILTTNIKRIIIDLRINGGGAMHPMILGVEQILGNGKVGSFQTKRKENWLIKDNRLCIDTSLLTAIIPKCTVEAQSIPVVL
jgi:hypothetical protein